MRVKSYKYLVNVELDRKGYMTHQYIELMDEYLRSIKLEGKCAFLYAGGVLLSASEARNVEDSGKYEVSANDSGVCIKEVAAYSMHKWIGRLDGRDLIKYSSINGNTCASSMHSLYEAERLLTEGYDEVVIVAEEKTSYNTLRIFDEMGIDIKVGEGCVVMHLGKANGPSEEDITDCKWSYEWNKNPFGVTKSGYESVWTECDMVNPHGTGTDHNEQAEDALYGDREQLRYKRAIGHTQGVSGILEVCKVMEEDVEGEVLCVSSGLGGFYGSCIIHM